MIKRGLSVIVLASAAAGCGGGASQYLDIADTSCRAGRGDDCWQAGEMRLHKASWNYFTGWDRPMDAKLARKAYRRGCELNSIHACEALIERHLVDDQPEEKAELLARLEAAGITPRTDEEVAAMDAALKEVARADVAQKEKRDRADLAQQMQKLSQTKVTGTPGHLVVETPETAAAKAQLKQAVAQLDPHVPAPGQAQRPPSQPPDAKNGQKPVGAQSPAAHSGGRPTGTSGTSSSALVPPSTPPAQCAPLGATCNAQITCCGQGQGFSIGANDCPQGRCCAQNSAKCTTDLDCCNVTPSPTPAGGTVFDVCGAAKLCCRPKGVPSNDDGSVCCHGGNPHTGCL